MLHLVLHKLQVIGAFATTNQNALVLIPPIRTGTPLAIRDFSGHILSTPNF